MAVSLMYKKNVLRGRRGDKKRMEEEMEDKDVAEDEEKLKGEDQKR